jgi:uncharacterized protein
MNRGSQVPKALRAFCILGPEAIPASAGRKPDGAFWEGLRTIDQAMPGETASTLIASLQTAAAFPHPVTSIELNETHISWVVLTGPFAYKIKKPVDLGFVDFTSLDERRFYCEEELRLNRRLAPELYRSVLPICGTPQKPTIGGTGTPIEWCVQMRQFDQACLLNRQITEGVLAARHIDGLARQIAEFHGRIPKADAGSPFGTPREVAEPIRSNFSHLEQLDSADDQNLVERLKAWCNSELQQLEKVILDRKRRGFVRECHGDMHLGNMFLEGDAVTIFDCIEFNESLRWIDVMSEIAFCTMDLEDHARPDFAWRFLNALLEWSGDYEGLALFALYFVYRALVRAKVSRIRAEQADLREDDRADALDAVSRYLALAARTLEKKRPFLAITHGLSGSGKTWGTQTLLERYGLIRIRSDVERKRLAGLAPTAKTDSAVAGGIYSLEFNRRTFARLAELSSPIVDAGFPLIVDATFLRRSEREQFRGLAASLGVPFAILEFPTDEATCRARIRQRLREDSDASEATEQVLDRQLQWHEPLSDSEQSDAVPFDGRNPQAAVALLARRVGIR